jgi:hypothetical protein
MRLDAAAAERLVTALRRAGCRLDIVDGDLVVSPPLRRVRWPSDPQLAIDLLYDDLRRIVLAEQHTASQRFTIH